MTDQPARAWTKLGAFAVTLALVFGVAFGIGRAVGPLDDSPAEVRPDPVVDLHGNH